jgi:tetratricopeptide (TPR) repeat protein
MNIDNPKKPNSPLRFLLPAAAFFLLATCAVRAQDSGGDNLGPRGNRGEISVTVRDTSGQMLPIAAAVKLYHDGMPAGQGTTSHGRAFFMTTTLGNFTVTVEANGYKAAQKDLSMPIAIRAEVDVILERTSVSGDSGSISAKPVLAPKAKEAFDKALQALNANKLDDAEKYLAEAVKLAPGHPDVLFVQGVLYLNRRNWSEAQAVLEKTTQLDPSNGRAFAALGMALNGLGKYPEAVPAFEKSLQLDPPGTWETHWALAKAYYYHEQYQESLKASQQALAESSGKAPQIELLVAQSLTAVGRYEDAAAALREFIKNNSNRPEAATAKKWLDGLAKNGKIKAN